MDDPKNSHKRTTYVKNGTTTVADIEGNCSADTLADQGVKMHTSVKSLLQHAQLRKDITVITQRMLLDVWTHFLTIDAQSPTNEAAAQDEAAVEEL